MLAMNKVEFRLLQFIISHVTGDRVSVALLHWDGRQLRVASSLDHLAVCSPAQRQIVRSTVKILLAKAAKVARGLTRRARLDLGLRELFPVREGLGAALYWTPPTVVETGDIEAHFEELSAKLRLDREGVRQPRRFSSRALGHQLVAGGERLAASAPDRVKLEHEVRSKKTYVSPLSWKNGKWHDTLPFSLDGLDEEQITRESAQLLGLAELALPADHVPVVIAAFHPQLAQRTTAEANIVKRWLSKRGCVVLPAPVSGHTASLDDVLKRVEDDIR
jgi:hypothetical protein